MSRCMNLKGCFSATRMPSNAWETDGINKSILDHIGHFDKIARASEGITLPFFAYRNKFGHGLKDLPCQMGENYAELQ